MHSRIAGIVSLACVTALAVWSSYQTQLLQRRVDALEARLSRPSPAQFTAGDLQFRFQLIESRLNAVELELEPTFVRRQLAPYLRAVRDYPNFK